MRFLILGVVGLLLASCGEKDPLCNENVAVFPDDLVLNSIPYQNGNVVTFRTNLGTQISAISTRDLTDFPERSYDCLAMLTIQVKDINVESDFLLESILEGDNGMYYGYLVTTGPNRTVFLHITLNDNNSVPEPLLTTPSQRLIGDTTLAERNYQNVLVQSYPADLEDGIAKVYFTVPDGIVQIDHFDGYEIYLVD